MPRLGRKPGVRAARRAATTEQILAAVNELLAEGESFGALSIEQIAERAGISRSGFYDYFDDKRELLIMLIRAADIPLFGEPEDPAKVPSEPELIEAQIRASLKWIRANAEIFRAAVEASSYDEVIGEFWQEQLVNPFIDATETRIKRQQSAGDALPIHPRVAAVAMVVMIIETAYHHVSLDTGISDKKVCETLTAMVLRTVYGPVDKLAAKP